MSIIATRIWLRGTARSSARVQRSWEGCGAGRRRGCRGPRGASRLCALFLAFRFSCYVFLVSSAYASAALQAVRSVDHKIFLIFVSKRIQNSREHPTSAKRRGSAVQFGIFQHICENPKKDVHPRKSHPKSYLEMHHVRCFLETSAQC